MVGSIAQVSVGGPGTVYPFETAQVWTREEWNHPWTIRHDLFCKKCTKSVGGAIGTASIGPWRYATDGKQLKGFGTDRFRDTPSLDIDRHYVKIEWTSNTEDFNGSTKNRWYGIITRQDEAVLGKGLGNQTWEARSLEWLFTRVQIASSRVESVSAPGTAFTVNRPITFNAGSGEAGAWSEASELGNRTTSKITGYHAFTHTLPGSKWSVADIAEYLIAFHWPLSVITLSLLNDWSDLAWDTPTIVTDGRTFYDVMQQLVDPRRGFAWSGELNTQETELSLRLHSFSDVDITLPQSGNTITANPEQRNLNFQNLNLSTTIQLEAKDSQRKYEQVTVTGARKGVCMSFSFDTNDLAPDWNAAQQTAYNTASAGGKTTVHDKKQTCDSNRQKDSLSAVYRRYRVNTSTLDSVLFPDLHWETGIRLQPKLPLLQYHDYSTDPANPADNTPAGSKANFRNMFVTIKLPKSGRRAYIDKLNSNSYSELEGDGGVDFSCGVRPRNDSPSFDLTTHSIPHVLGLNTFDDSTCPTDVQPQVDYRTMSCTVFLEQDDVVSSSWPAAADPDVNDMASVLYVRLGGNKARQDKLLVGTILDIDDNGDHITAAASGLLRDDSGWMEDIARAAYSWYATPRKAIHVVFPHFVNSIPIGALLTDIDGTAINTMATAITWDHVTGATTLRTSFADVDFTS